MGHKERKKCSDVDFLFYSIVGGFSSSIGSLLGKLSRSMDALFLIKGILFVLMIIFNTIGMLNFTKSLNLSSSSLKSMLVTSASNYLSTAVLGSLLLEEKTPLLWWCGTILIIIGLVIVSIQQVKADKIEPKNIKSY